QSQLYEFRNKTGRYAIIQLSDRTGSIRGICWDIGEHVHKTVQVGSIVYVEGKVESYNDQLQINVHNVALSQRKDYNPSDFLPVSGVDTEKMFQYLLKEIEQITDKHLQKLLRLFFTDAAFVEKFKRAPAAKSIHHSHLGGLVEHTVNCLKIGKTVCENYPQLNRNILLAGIMLHDAGKIEEFEYENKIGYTDRGRLLGHIVIGEQMIYDKIKSIKNFPEKLAHEFLHLIISHHGESPMGSPKRPKTPEACALHYLENLDAQTNRFLQIIQSQPLGYTGAWTPYDRLLDRYLFRGYTCDEEILDEED
ncbi:MAG: HD domain-containing protein, partial [bacterium]